MPTFSTQVVDNQILINVAVELAYSGSHEPLFVPALVDTGAQATMVSQWVVDSLKAKSIGTSPIMGVTGERTVERYTLGISIPISVKSIKADGVEESVFGMGSDLSVLLLPYDPPNYHVLLGMDVLSQFHLTMYNGLVIFSN